MAEAMNEPPQEVPAKSQQSDQPTYQCSYCEVSFRSEALLARHTGRLHRPAKQYNCPQCDAGFNSPKNFAIHRAIHGPKPFKCPRCAIIFRRHASLVGHLQRHYVSEEHMCVVCDLEFGSLDELRLHIYQGHEGRAQQPKQPPKINIIPRPEKPVYKCTLCENKIFSKRSLLERHYLVHTKQKPFKCEICGKSFNQKCTLKTHSLVHSKIQDHVCLLCGLKFSQKVNLRIHTLRVHPKRSVSIADRLQCPYCPCLFKKLGSLNAHKTRSHAALLPDPTKSSNGQNTPASDRGSASSSLSSGFRKRTIQHDNPDQDFCCPFCDKMFKSPRKCESHIQSTHAAEVERNGLTEPIVTGINQEEEAPEIELNLAESFSGDAFSDLNNPSASDRSMFDINSIVNYVVQIDDQLYEIPVQIATDPLSQGPHFLEIVQEPTSNQDQTNVSYKLISATEDELLDYINITPEDALPEEETFTQFNPPEPHPQTPSPEPEIPSKPAKPDLSGKTEQELFSESTINGRKSFLCKGCSKTFKKRVDLRRHIRTHTGERPFKCDHCPKSFTLKAVLQNHLKTHATDRELLSCPEPDCDSKFSCVTSLKMHHRLHTGHRPFRCSVCTLTFRTSGHLQAHMVSHKRLAKRREQNMLQYPSSGE